MPREWPKPVHEPTSRELPGLYFSLCCNVVVVGVLVLRRRLVLNSRIANRVLPLPRRSCSPVQPRGAYGRHGLTRVRVWTAERLHKIGRDNENRTRTFSVTGKRRYQLTLSLLKLFCSLLERQDSNLRCLH